MDNTKFDACKDKVRQSVLATINTILVSEWDRILASMTAVTELDDKFQFGITVDITPHEGGISHIAGIKYKCTREAQSDVSFTRYDGSEETQGDLFDEADELNEAFQKMAADEGHEDFEAFLESARDVIIEKKLATAGTLMFELACSQDLAEKTLSVLEMQGFIGHQIGDEPRDIIALREDEQNQHGGQSDVDDGDVDKILAVLSENGYPNKEAFLAQAQEQVVETGRATVTIIQRRLQVPFGVAHWALEQLQDRGIVTAPDSEGKRSVVTAAESNAAAEGIANG